VRILGSGWAAHFSKPVAEAAHANITRVGMPQWSEADQTFARALQEELGSFPTGLQTQVGRLNGAATLQNWTGGGSDDIGDVSWNVPTITLRYPSNVPGLPGHHWSNAIAMATPVAHKGGVAGAKVQALTMLDLLLTPSLIAEAKAYFTDVQTKETKYKSFLGPDDAPPTYLNADIMARYRERMRPYYYDPSKFSTYLEQLGISYPTLRTRGTQDPVPDTDR
jgi:aminobenzoyl-glutamate utilization protein B